MVLSPDGNIPTEQAVHDVAFGSGLTWPGGHTSHAVAATLLTVPASQARHSVQPSPTDTKPLAHVSQVHVPAFAN